MANVRTVFYCSGVVKFHVSREQFLNHFIKLTGLKHGELRIKVQDGRFTSIEATSYFRNTEEGLVDLEKCHFS